MNDVRKMIYGTIGLFLVGVIFWLSLIFISACGLSFSCRQAQVKFEGTPIPTLIPAAHVESQTGSVMVEFNKCQVSAIDLISAWVTAKSPETEPFSFSDIHGKPCEGTFAVDIQPLFVENSLWYTGAIGCIACHNSELAKLSGGLDLTTYDAILLGSRRVAGSSSAGNDILAGGDWQKSLLYDVLVNQGLVTEGHSADKPAVNVLIYAGQSVAQDVTITPTP